MYLLDFVLIDYNVNPHKSVNLQGCPLGNYVIACCILITFWLQLHIVRLASNANHFLFSTTGNTKFEFDPSKIFSSNWT